MKILQHSLTILMLLSGSFLAKAQNVDEIISKHLDAIGGKDKIGQVKSLYIESTVQVMGNDGPSTLSIVDGKGYRLETEANGQKLVQCFTDKGGWAINPFAGGTDAQAIPDDMYKAGKGLIYIAGPLVDYASKGSRVEWQGQEEGAFKIKVVNKDSIESTFYIDPGTYYIRKLVEKGTMMGQEMEISHTYSDYRKTDFGYVVPYTIEISYGGQFNVTSTVKKVEVNKDIDPKIFDMPK